MGSYPADRARPSRFLIATWDGAGNLPPERTLVRELVRRGHEVHVVSHDSTADRFRSDGAIVHRYETADQVTAAQPFPRDREFAMLSAQVFESEALAADLLALAHAIGPDACLVDFMLLRGLARLLEEDVPVGVLYHSMFLDALLGRLDPAWRRSRGAFTGRSLAEFFDRLPLVLVFSYRQLADRAPAESVHFVGPIRAPAAEQSSPRGDGKPFILTSLSTGFMDQADLLQTIVDAAADLPARMLVTTGPSLDPSGSRVPPNVEMRTFVAHDEVLPGADLVITHGGHGTIAAAVGSGVPLLCIPCGRDQPLVAARLEQLGLAVALPREAKRTQIRSAIERLLGDAGAKLRARSFAAGLDPFGDVGQAADLVERLAVRG